MNKTATALVVKFVMTFVLAALLFTVLDRNALVWSTAVAVAGTILNYFLGDLYVLPKFGNLTASVGDGILAILVAYIVDLAVLDFRTTVTSLILFGALVAVGEYFFHQYLLRSEKVAPE